jgi:hypothetical protein
MKIVELILDENDELNGIEAISIVEKPAIEEDFVALKDIEEVKFAKLDDEKRILLGPVLIPNKPILRRGKEDNYYIYFSRDTVRKASELYLKKGNQGKSTLEHEHSINGLTLVESWIVEDKEKDKSNLYGMDVALGTWMGAIKVDNDEIWNEYVKSGKVKGFSIEGYFADKSESPQEKGIKDSLSEIEEEEKESILNSLRSLLNGDKEELESYSDYPAGVKNNAKKGIELNKKVNNKCATQVGKIRARQLASGKGLTKSTIKRMYSYLSRAEEYYDEGDTKACGTISYLLWGGLAGKRWAKSKLDSIEASATIIDGRAAYSSKEQAEKAAKDIGCEGYHTHDFEGETWYMPCEEHNLAKVGKRGGITKSPKAPKSDTPNKNPKGKGSAKGNAKGKTGAKVTAKDRATLQKKSDDFNEKYKKKLGYGVTVGSLASVYQRGLGAFNTSHSPNVSSASQWGFARVNAFLYLVKNGRPQNAKYTQDYDLLPKGHPKSSK